LANREQRPYVVLTHVDAALDRVMELGEAHLVFMWEQFQPQHQHILLTAAALVTSSEPVTAATLAAAAQASLNPLRRH